MGNSQIASNPVASASTLPPTISLGYSPTQSSDAPQRHLSSYYSALSAFVQESSATQAFLERHRIPSQPLVSGNTTTKTQSIPHSHPGSSLNHNTTDSRFPSSSAPNRLRSFVAASPIKPTDSSRPPAVILSTDHDSSNVDVTLLQQEIAQLKAQNEELQRRLNREKLPIRESLPSQTPPQTQMPGQGGFGEPSFLLSPEQVSSGLRGTSIILIEIQKMDIKGCPD